MKLKLSDLWRWDGEIGRGSYFLWGLILMVVKFNVDRLAGRLLFDKPWSVFDKDVLQLYLWQSVPSRAEQPYYLVLLALSTPFLWAGMLLTIKRLRSLGIRPVGRPALFHSLWSNCCSLLFSAYCLQERIGGRHRRHSRRSLQV